MSEIKVGDRVRRVDGEFRGMDVGDEAVVTKISNGGLVLRGYEGRHGPSNFEVIKNADPRICIDVSEFDDAKKKRVIDAFYELGVEWFECKKYQNLTADRFSSIDDDGDFRLGLMYGLGGLTEPQLKYQHTYEELMQRAYGDAGHPDEREEVVWTHLVNGSECVLLDKEKDCDGYYITKTHYGAFELAKEHELKPIKPKLTKAEAWDMLIDSKKRQELGLSVVEDKFSWVIDNYEITN